ncbi:hypothetical protein F8O01_07940 [Pseudoclavibacter chungangensis]|uniref:Uncharacterized protein n=1 Tax=Pseudoclavibacter chungangensis TaxID=587635 RepID=A0A7J5BU72_9MICO|nr:hypothetical protein [Pseudoclavibacter chungangensis]KAB1657864.1 hypothetical protein F8O01_07940 [Pseudoclavibacter chungangensis]NYJ66535.1 hypothetical protein [Pseudoclavibacter chungangensis]
MSVVRGTLLVIGGVAAGFALAHLVNSTERGGAAFADLNAKIDAFREAVRDGYDARTQELLAAVERTPVPGDR